MPHIWFQNSLFAVKLVRNFIFLLVFLVCNVGVSQHQPSSALSEKIKIPGQTQNTLIWRKALLQSWQSKGFFAATVDSVDSETVLLTKGNRYDSLFVVFGTPEDTQVMTMSKYVNFYTNKLQNFENNGFPFASVSAIVLWQNESGIGIRPTFVTGNRYVLDSLLFDDEILSIRFVRFASGIGLGDVYNHSKTNLLLKKINAVDGLQMNSEPVLLAADDKVSLKISVNKRSKDYLSGIIGVATTTGKPVFTGDLRGKFYNLFGLGVSLGADWRSYRARSQQLEIKTSIPYLFGLPFISGFGVQFDKFDTFFSVFTRNVHIKMPVSRQFAFIAGTNVSDRIRIFADVNSVKNFRMLPENPASKVRSYFLGIETGNITDGTLAVRGYKLSIQAAAGTRSFIQDPRFSEITWVSSSGKLENIYDSLIRVGKMKTVQYKVEYNWEYLFPVGKIFSAKFGGQGLEMVSPELFFNELHRFGGIKSIRGFNEQSIFAGKFHMLLAEWRILTGKSGFFGPFYNIAYAENNAFQSVSSVMWLQGAGISAALKTGAGVLQIVWAVGKTNSEPFALNSSKFHFGISNSF